MPIGEFDPIDEDYNLWLFLTAEVGSVEGRPMEVSRYGITASQASVLFVVNALGDEATPAEISRWLFQQPHWVMGILNRMEKQGLVKRVKDLVGGDLCDLSYWLKLLVGTQRTNS